MVDTVFPSRENVEVFPDDRALGDYLESLVVSEGRLSGERLRLMKWQKDFLRGFTETDGISCLTLARGQGKTTLCAGIATATLDGPLMKSRCETVIVAGSLQQARVSFRHVKFFMGAKLELRSENGRKVFRVWDTMQGCAIENRLSGAILKCQGNDPRKAHGLAPSLVLADEPAQWDAKGEAMLSAMRTSAGKQAGFRMVCLGTRPAGPEHWFSRLLDGGADYIQIHAAAPGDPPFERETWLKANPGLDHLPDLEVAIQREAEAAQRDAMLLPAFEALRLNLGVSDVREAVLMEAAFFLTLEGESKRAGAVVWGMDLGTSAAQSAVAAYWPKTGRLEVLAAFPSEPSLSQRGVRDGVGDLYRQCNDRGELIQTGGKAVALGPLFAEALSRFGQPSAIAADRWRAAEAKDALRDGGVPPCEFFQRGQGFKDGGEDVRIFRRACAEGKVRPTPSLLLRSAMSEARTVSDAAGNSKLCKGSQGGRRGLSRDDAAAAAILAVSVGVRERQKLRPKRRTRFEVVA